MLKGQSIIGKKVLSRMDGQRIDSVRDIVISKDHARIVALILDEGSLFAPATAVAIENVVSFGKDAVVITDSKTVTRVEHFPAVKEIMDDRDSLVGKKVFTEAGNAFGKIEDVFFDEHTGNIMALEIVGKFVPTGKTTSGQLEMGDIVSIGPDAVIINMAAVPRLSGLSAGNTTQDEQPAPSTDAQPVLNDVTSGIQAESSMQDPTVGATLPTSDDLQTSMMPSTPMTSQLPASTSDDTESGADDASADMTGARGRVADPTSDGQS
jgi:uncharacterized protein YrrD